MAWLDALARLFDYEDRYDGFDYLFVDASGDVPHHVEAFVDGRLTAPPRSVDAAELWGEAHGVTDAFRTRGRFAADFQREREGFEAHDVALERRDDGGYDVTVEQRYSVEGPHRDRVGTRGNAAFTLERLLSAAADGLGDAVGGELESETWVEERDPRASEHDVLHVAYDAGIDGFDRGVLAGLAHGVAPERAPEGEEPVAVEDLAFSLESRRGGVACSWDVGIAEHNRLFLWLLEGSGYPAADALLRAKEATGYGASTRWTASYDEPALEAGVDVRTTNGDAFLDRCEAMDVPTPDRTSFDVDVRGRDGRVESTVSMEADAVRGVPTPGDVFGSDERWLWLLPSPLAVGLTMLY